MKAGLFALLILISFGASAETTARLLALKLWNAIEKEQNISYTELDNYRTKLPLDDYVRQTLLKNEEFKRYQLILRNDFIERVEKEFSVKEIRNLIKIYSRPEMEKLRLFSMSFWDEKRLKQVVEQHLPAPELPPPPPPPK
jgi:hypothetical protein